MLTRQADFIFNADLIAEVDAHRAHLVGDDAPDAADVIAAERERRE